MTDQEMAQAVREMQERVGDRTSCNGCPAHNNNSDIAQEVCAGCIVAWRGNADG